MSNPEEDILNMYQRSSHVCEIFLARPKWITTNIQRDDIDENAVAENIYTYLEGEFGSQPQDTRHIKAYLLHNYWQLTKSEFERHKLYLIQVFKLLIKCGGVMSQNPSIVSNSYQNLAISRSTSDEVIRPEHDIFMNEILEVDRNILKCLQSFEQIERDVVNNSAIGNRGISVFRALKNKKVKQQFFTAVDCDIQTLSSEYTEKRKAIFNDFQQLVMNLKENLQSLYKCIGKWKESHIKAYIKVGCQFNIVVLKQGCSDACRLILKMIELLNKDAYQRMVSCSDIIDQPPLDQQSAVHEDIEKQLIEDFKELFTRCFVVELEPTDVQKVTGSSDKGKNKGKGKAKARVGNEEMDKSNKSGPEFNVSVTILCGQGLECISTVLKPVKAKIYYEFNQIHDGPVSGQLSVPQVTVDKDGTAHFHKQKIFKFERPEKNNKSEQVTSERYRMVFETNLSLQNPNISLELKTMSLPMAIITGSNQANSAHGALLWYCYNTDPYLLHNLPEAIPTDKFKEMIQDCFGYLGGRLLRDDEMDFLLNRLFQGKQIKNEVQFEKFEVSHKSKDDKTIPFWKWLQAILNLIEFFLLRPWRDGVIYGFVSRSRTDELLHDEPAGVFLLRFSESQVIGDGQNKNLTGAVVAAFSRGPGSKAILSRPLTVDMYFSKYSLYTILSGIQNEDKGRQLLKKLYGTNTSIKDFKTLYHYNCNEKDVSQNLRYPSWSQQTLLMLNDLNLSDDDDDDDDENDDDEDNDDDDDVSVSNDGSKRKKPKRRHESMNSSVYSPDIQQCDQQPETFSPSHGMILPQNAVDDLLKVLPSTSASPFTSFISSMPTCDDQNTLGLSEEPFINAVGCSSESILQQTVGQDSSLSNHSSVVLSSVHSDMQSPGNTPSHDVLNTQYPQHYDYGVPGWSPGDPHSSQQPTVSSPVFTAAGTGLQVLQQNEMDSSGIPLPVQELSDDFMNLSGPAHISDFQSSNSSFMDH